MTTDHLFRVQTEVERGEYKAHHSAQDWVGVAVARVFGLDASNKADRARMIQMLKVWTDNGSFKEEERKDKNRQWKRFLVVDRWASE